MSQEVPIFDGDNPQTPHDILWAWSERKITTKEAMKRLWVDDKIDLYQAALDNNVPFPGKADERDLKLAEDFLEVVQGSRP